MNKPSAFTMLWGHGLVFAGLCLATCWFGYLSFQDSGAILPAIVTLAASASSKKANDQRRAYHAWQREWEAMGGAPTAGLSRRAQQRIGAFIVWGLMASIALYAADDPSSALGVTLFWWASAAIPVVALIRALRRATQHGTDDSQKYKVVTVCLRPSAQSNNLEQAFARLPEYCRHIFQCFKK
jgi:hypothetical protein